MADSLQTWGKVVAMTGIATEATLVALKTSPETFSTTVGDSLTVSGLANFQVDNSTGTLTNRSALVFTINADDVGKTATQISIGVAGTGEMLLLDLDTPLVVSLAGEATIAAGALSATL